MKGEIEVRLGENGPVCGSIAVSPSEDWRKYSGNVKVPAGVQELYFAFGGRGKLDMLEFEFEES